jgi:hypothetical protein
MSREYAAIDFEYNTTNEAKLNLVCCSILKSDNPEPIEYWLYNDDAAYVDLNCHLDYLNKLGYHFLSFNATAEAQAFISLGLDPVEFKWIDLQLEWKMLCNHNHKYMYGKQLIGGKKKTTYPPKNKWQQTEEEKRLADNSKPDKNLAAFLYKMLNVEVDTEHKNLMRDIIIFNDEREIQEYRHQIQSYCTSDVEYLIPAYWEVVKAYKISLGKEHRPKFNEVLYRGETAARTAKMMSLGYPINLEKVKRFAASVPEINKELAEDINSQFDEDLFKWNNKDQRYSKKIKYWKEIIAKSEYADKWMRTYTGDFSCSLDAFEKLFSYRHNFPEGNFFAQVMRYLKTQRSFNGFLPKGKTAKNKETFFDSVGSDERARAWLNPYGAQSARYQPKATGFIPLKASWMRSLIEPKKGRAICGIDYGSQEFLLAALISKDKNMIEAYKSGDVYLYFAKLAGAVPWEGKKEDYKEERNLFKSTTLGISYNMAAQGLSRKLTDDTGKEVTIEEAQELINKFEKAYPDYAQWIKDVRYTYYNHSKCIKLDDGWIMFGDNDNKRSVSNVPIQGMGSCIIRRSIAYAQDKGLDVLYPLHDADYIEYNSYDWGAITTLKDCMKEAFVSFFPDQIEEASLIRLDVDTWGPDYVEGMENPVGAKVQKIYIDERSISEYERFKKYMEE